MVDMLRQILVVDEKDETSTGAHEEDCHSFSADVQEYIVGLLIGSMLPLMQNCTARLG